MTEQNEGKGGIQGVERLFFTGKKPLAGIGVSQAGNANLAC